MSISIRWFPDKGLLGYQPFLTIFRYLFIYCQNIFNNYLFTASFFKRSFAV